MANPGSVTEFELELLQLLGLDQYRCISIDLSLKAGALPILVVESVDVETFDLRTEEWTTTTRRYLVVGMGKLAPIPLAEDNEPLQSS